MSKPNPPSQDAIKRMKEIFCDPSHKHDFSKFPTETELEELKLDYNLTSGQIMKEFRKMRNAEALSKKRANAKFFQAFCNPTKTTAPISHGVGYPFENCSFKQSNISTTVQDIEAEKARHNTARQATKCKCFSLERQCVASFEQFFEAGQVICKNARWMENFSNQVLEDSEISIHVRECTNTNCGNEGDCGNKYSKAPTHLGSCVIAKQFNNNGEPIRGLKVREGCSIPGWEVIGEYTGTVTKRRKNKDSQYIVEIDNFTFIDAENEGNCTRFINHRCQDFNAVLIPVRIGSQDTVFVRSIKPIQENEFVSIHYGSNYRKFFQYCLCETCSPN